MGHRHRPAPRASSVPPLLELENFTAGFRQTHERAIAPTLRGVNLRVDRGESVAIVGESGSGKTLTALAIMGLLPRGAKSTRGHIAFDGEPLTPAEVAARRRSREHGVSMIFQAPRNSLNPVRTVGQQIERVLAYYQSELSTARERRGGCLDLLSRVGMRDVDRVSRAYPHQLSGGLAQRAMIAMALASRPKLLIADEPTTSLDVTIQAEILKLLSDLREDLGMSLLMITHDLGVVSEISDRVVVMQQGEVVETAAVGQVFAKPQNSYTRQLVESLPKPGESRSDPGAGSRNDVVVAVRDLHKSFTAGGRRTAAVNGITFDIHRGETLALVGESGCGKSTTARCILGLETPDAGDIRIENQDVSRLTGREWRRMRSKVQMVFQDPTLSLNPSLRVADTLREAVRLHDIVPRHEEAAYLEGLMRQVQLDPKLLKRYPSELSGGQKQRICIARALAPRPSLIVLDEPTSALDVSLRRSLMKLLTDLQEQRELSYLFITHDFASLGMIAHRVIVMYQGSAVETASTQAVIQKPEHEYTRKLVAAVPAIERGQRVG